MVNGVVVTTTIPNVGPTPDAASLMQPGSAAATAVPDPFDGELRGFQYDVTVGNWPLVKTFLAKLPEDEGKAAFEQLIQGLGNPPVMQGNAQMQQQMQMQQMQMQMQMNMGMSLGQGARGAAQSAAVHDGAEFDLESGLDRAGSGCATRCGR